MLVECSVAGRSLRADVADRNAGRAKSALRAFEMAGELRSGTEMRFGWSALRLVDRDADDGALSVCEPDFAAWPDRRWSPGIDLTLDIAAAQVELLARAAADGDDATYDQVVLAAPGALDEQTVFLRRMSPAAAHDSGWVLGPADDPDALARAQHLEAVAIAQLVTRRPALVSALALPGGFIAVVGATTVERIYDAAGRERLGAR